MMPTEASKLARLDRVSLPPRTHDGPSKRQRITEALLNQAHDLSARYLRERDRRSVMPTGEALANLRRLHEPLPEAPAEDHEVIATLDRLGSPAAVATTGGRFFGFVVGGALPVAVAANWLATAWDQNAGTYILAPGAAEFEEVAAGWLLELFDLPRDATVGFVTGSTMGAFCAFAAARSALLNRMGWNVKRRGLNGAPPLRIVTSEELHPTNLAALGYAGFGLDAVEYTQTDAQGRLIAARMPPLDETTIVILQAGNINSGACDPFREVCERAKRAGAWVHIDGAFGLWARVAAGIRDQTDGMELADSWSVDGHKWLNLPQDSAVYICRDAAAVHDVFGVQATYLVRDEHRQPNQLTPELSRRARGVEFWAALKSLGRSGVAQLIHSSCSHARRFGAELARMGYEVRNEIVLNQVVFDCGDEARTRAALAHIQASGVTWLGPTTWKGRFSMRISVSSWATTEDDVTQSLAVFEQAFAASSDAGRLRPPGSD